MTLRNSPLAIDGALIDSATLRIQAYANAGGNDGIIGKGDFKVSSLAVDGNGVSISRGAAIVLNRYQTDVDQAYVVSNVGPGILDAADMPAANAAARSHIIAVTVGDPEFSQAGHPWMPSSVPLGEEQTFQYVRFHVIQNVGGNAGANYVKNLGYPALALARIDIPANTTTITDAMITDLRKLANPRNTERIEHIAAGASNALKGDGNVPGAFEGWPGAVQFALEIPDWAVRAKITGFVEGARLTKAGGGSLRVAIDGAGTTEWTQINESAPTSGADRRSYNVGGEIAIPEALRGTTATIRMQGTANNVASQSFLTTDSATSGQIRVRLEEERT